VIRINLLAKTRHVPRVTTKRLVISGGVAVGVMTVVFGVWEWRLTRELARLNATLAQTDRRAASLRESAARTDRAATRTADLAAQLDVLDGVHADQRRLVTLLSIINRSMSDGLWLTELRRRGTSIQITGNASSLAAVTIFVQRLDASRFFDRPVEVTATDREVIDEVGVVRFTVSARMQEANAGARADPVRRSGTNDRSSS
jgi:Tfp pilus assembly protein PilN